MHPFPPAQELQFLVEGDACLSQFSIGRHQVVFVFENECTIQAMDSVSHVRRNGEIATYPGEWFEAPPIGFQSLLGRRLTAVTTQPAVMTLSFEGGEALLIHADDSSYECCLISDHAHALIVI